MDDVKETDTQVLSTGRLDEIGERYGTPALAIEIKGLVTGSVYTHSFMAMENGSRYQNHLFEGRINSTALSESYAGLALAGKTSKQIARWVE